ncbi:cell division protein FtsQ/DivIB [Aureimonas mangrovi]|uniref:cell division protein FtsQ/DivIB n=1 Tax=Aureimonas mangrovi TaxID=2758041 RepID=UPI001FE7A7F7|nr:cell division protein FtsQ/DivIB [Aureimonas mangrovi]
MRALTHRASPEERMERLALRAGIAMKRINGYAHRLQRLPLPRFWMMASVVLSSSALYGTALGGHAPVVLDTISAPFGFSIDRVDVSGNSETSQIDILQTLYMTGAQTVAGLDVEATREAIEAMPWIDQASITKVYPDRVAVEVVERAPYAVWQRGRELMVIDRDGNEIVPYATTRFTDLPFVVGAGAERDAAELLDRIEVIPELTPRIRAYVRVAHRRWDLHLDNGVIVKLPEIDPIEAAAEVVRMDRDTGLLSRDIVSVDMRVDDRMTVKLTPEAKERREAALAERARLAKARRENPV